MSLDAGKTFPRHAEPGQIGRGLVARGLSKGYAGATVLSDVSFSLAPGEIIALMGPNGAGKSTTYRMVVGTERPDRGRIAIDGLDVTRLPDYARARCGLSYLPQEPSAFKGLSVIDNIALVLEHNVPDPAARQARLSELLDEMDLTAVADRKPARLSGGQRRRCEIARLLAANPRYVLLDEPFAGVDPLSVAQVNKHIRGLAERGIGIVITDQNVRETLSIADRVIVLAKGRVVADSAPETILADPAIWSLWLGENFAM